MGGGGSGGPGDVERTNGGVVPPGEQVRRLLSFFLFVVFFCYFFPYEHGEAPPFGGGSGIGGGGGRAMAAPATLRDRTAEWYVPPGEQVYTWYVNVGVFFLFVSLFFVQDVLFFCFYFTALTESINSVWYNISIRVEKGIIFTTTVDCYDIISCNAPM